MQRRVILLVAFAPLLLLLLGARAPRPMYMPPPIKIYGGLSVETVNRVVEEALHRRRWSVTESKVSADAKSGVVRTTLYIRVHTLSIEFKIDPKYIHIVYVSSTELGYKKKRKGKQLIHPKYTTWIKNLEHEIRDGLRLAERGNVVDQIPPNRSPD